MPNTTPQRTHTVATRALLVFAPLTLTALCVYFSGWWLSEAHARMLCHALLMATATSVVVSAVAAGQLAIANAFRAGYLTGIELGKAEQAAQDQRRLHVVRDSGTGTGGHPPVR